VVEEVEEFVTVPAPAIPAPLTEEEIADHFDGMGQCADLINSIVADDGPHIAGDPTGAAGVMDTVGRNVRHLEGQAEKDWYSDSSKSKTPYTSAVAAGKAYVAA
jgi:hypothetical protein